MKTIVLQSVWRMSAFTLLVIPTSWFLAPAPSIEVQILGSALAVVALEAVFVILGFYTECAEALATVWNETWRVVRRVAEARPDLMQARAQVLAPVGVDASGRDVWVRAKPRRAAKGSKTPYGLFAVTSVLRIA